MSTKNYIDDVTSVSKERFGINLPSSVNNRSIVLDFMRSSSTRDIRHAFLQ